MKKEMTKTLSDLKERAKQFFKIVKGVAPVTSMMLLEDSGPMVFSEPEKDEEQMLRFYKHIKALERLPENKILAVEIPDQVDSFTMKKLLSTDGYSSGGGTMSHYLDEPLRDVTKMKGGRFMILPNHKNGFDDQILMQVFGMDMRDLIRVFYLQYALTISTVAPILKDRGMLVAVGYGRGLGFDYPLGSIKWFDDKHGQDWALGLSQSGGTNVAPFLLIPF